MFKDSLDKIVESYFSAITRQPFTYKGKDYVPHDLRVSAGTFRGYTCPANCGACCHRFSLDYLPSERRPAFRSDFPEREVEFNGKSYTLRSNTQENSDDRHCNFVNKKGDGPQEYDSSLDLGRCQIHGEHPFTCDFELLRFSHAQPNEETGLITRPNYLNQRLYGRGWAMTRVDGQKKAMCEMLPPDDTWKEDTQRRITRLMNWADYFELDHCLLEIIGWVATGPHDEPLTIRNGANYEGSKLRSLGINEDRLPV
jgi:Fe-S-cluster containining protein